MPAASVASPPVTAVVSLAPQPPDAFGTLALAPPDAPPAAAEPPPPPPAPEPPGPEPVAEAPAPDAAPAAGLPAVEGDATDQAVAPAAPAAPAAEPEAAPEPPAPAAETAEPEPEVPAPDVAAVEPQPEPEAEEGPAAEAAPRLITDGAPPPDAPGVVTSRLPRIEAPAPQEDAAPPAAQSPSQVAEPRRLPGAPAAPILDSATAEGEVPAGTPLLRFARPFDNPAGKPRLAILLIDTGGMTLDREALAALPFPVTFALDPMAPESPLAATIYRNAGQEVVMLATGIPKGATAADVEVSFAALAEALPESVAVLDLPEGGFQGNRSMATLAIPVIAAQGRGVLSWDRGLNAADQVARREGTPSATIYRLLDGAGEDEGAMRRALDRAAFRAAQDGSVIVAGETRPETVAALLAWAGQGKAATVALAPVTAVLSAP